MSDDLSWSEIFAVVRQRWRLLALTTFLFAAIAAVIGFLMTPVYRSSALLIPNEANERSGILGSAVSQLGGLASLAGLGALGGNAQNATTEALAVLQSQNFVEEFISAENLLPKLFPRDWDASRNNWRPSLRKIPTPFMGYRRFTQDVMSVSQDKKTNLIKVEIDWTNREEGAAWANELIERVNQRMRERSVSEADETIKYLQQELPTTDSIEVRLAVSSMMEQQLKTKALAEVRKQYAFRVIDPAIAPDADFKLRPHKAIYIVLGGGFGLLCGVAIVFLSAPHRKLPTT